MKQLLIASLLLLLMLSACSGELPVTPAPQQAAQPAAAATRPTVRKEPTPSPTAQVRETKPASEPEAAATKGETVREAPQDLVHLMPFDGPLSVVIFTPGDEMEVKAQMVAVIGQADPGTVITIEDEIALVGQDGKFVINVPLEAGLNMLEITASDAQGNQETDYLNVTYAP